MVRCGSQLNRLQVMCSSRSQSCGASFWIKTSVLRNGCRPPSVPLARKNPVEKPRPSSMRVFKDREIVSGVLRLQSVADDRARATSTEEVTVEEIMNPHPLVLHVDTPVKEAVRLLLEKDISGAPVLDASGKLVGVLSESDLIWKGVGAPQDHFIIPPVYIGLADLMVAWRDNAAFEEEVHKILAKTVGEAMTPNPVSVPPSMTMSDAAAMLVKKKVNRLPVVQEGKVVGVLSRHDVLMGLVATNSPFL